MDADIEARVRELEIASSVHSINTKKLENNTLELVRDIKDIKETINIGIGKSGMLSMVVVVAVTVLVSYLSWTALNITEHAKSIVELRNKLATNYEHEHKR